MIRSLFRLALYLGAGILIFRFINRLRGKKGKAPIDLRNYDFFFPSRKKDPKVIDLCAHCGKIQDSQHYCIS